MKKYNLEIACFNPESAVIAQENGANRVELCAEMNEGGTTPSYEDVIATREKLTIDMNVMIRPRGGNFVYSDAEFEQMKQEIKAYKELKVDGFVFGILNKDNSINVRQNKELVTLAKPLPCTFHRAFDVVSDVYNSLETVIECGFKTILTSGQEPNVVKGISVLEQLAKKAGDRIVIMPGGGVRSSNVAMLKEKMNTTFYHSSAITDGTETADGKEVENLVANLK
ncbi:copper homeostasis protein CutC [Flavobacterium gilvum]|uniref:PF03932 family protein CutC n=1 Tax=Flavobacterium gilvum TaxID=1492737 RepID=A0AAC9I7M9_9FLAO|nr:copper homeostasis protein CutC [Flavobacterium gilvum]AOW10313.1 copper homeostasis protein [Flavobacterium gilvum]KFC59800.1 copper homeostasis protein [Flavobacterium gilvum]